MEVAWAHNRRVHELPQGASRIARNRLVKSMSEKAWMDYYVLGTGRQFAWRDVLATLEATEPARADTSAAAPVPGGRPDGR